MHLFSYSRYLLIALCTTFLLACESSTKKEYVNKAEQTVKVGEKVRIYYTTNSCCNYCAPGKNDLKYLEFIEEETVVPYPDDCDGCSRTKALVFEAKSKGTDTFRGRILDRGTDCSDSLTDWESFIIHVK